MSLIVMAAGLGLVVMLSINAVILMLAARMVGARKQGFGQAFVYALAWALVAIPIHYLAADGGMSTDGLVVLYLVEFILGAIAAAFYFGASVLKGVLMMVIGGVIYLGLIVLLVIAVMASTGKSARELLQAGGKVARGSGADIVQQDEARETQEQTDAIRSALEPEAMQY